MRLKIQHTLILFVGLLIGTSAFAQHESPVTSSMDCPIHTPNAFTPNGDGVNDFFYFTFKTDCTPIQFSLQILDRYGRLVFETRDPQQSWDGTFNGQELKDGAYFWLMSAQVSNQEQTQQFQKKGSVIIIR